MKPQYKTVILVLSTDSTPLYREFKQLWLKFHTLNPDCKIHFVYANSKQTPPDPSDIVLNYIEENYPTTLLFKQLREQSMMQKTFDALQWINDTYNYQHLIRTNLSTVWNLTKHQTLLDTLPTEKLATGTLRQVGTNETYISGTDLTLSKDCVKLLVENKDYILRLPYSEDWAMSHYLKHYKHIPLQQYNPKTQAILEHYSEYNYRTFDQDFENFLPTITHYRIKNKEPRLTIDIAVAKHILNKIYNI